MFLKEGILQTYYYVGLGEEGGNLLCLKSVVGGVLSNERLKVGKNYN